MNNGTFPGIGDGAGVQRPLRVTTYTSGSGTFSPLVPNSWCRVTLVGAGAGGRRPQLGAANLPGGGGGGGAQTVTAWMLFAGPQSYAVGAAGLGATADNTYGTSGGNTVLGALIAQGGQSSAPGGPLYGGSAGGFPFNSTWGNSGQHGFSVCGGGTNIVGYSGLPAQGGIAAGQGTSNNNNTDLFHPNAPGGTTSGGTHSGGSGGGCSMYGVGGAGGNGNSAGAGGNGSKGTGYGAGGGGGGSGNSATGNGADGTGGLIIIEEYGALP